MTTQCSFRYLDHGHSMSLAVVNVLSRSIHAILASDVQQYVNYLHDGQVFMVIEFDPRKHELKIGAEFPVAAMPTALREFFTVEPTAPAPPPALRQAGLLTDINSVFKFGMGDEVRIGATKLVGVVKARSEHEHERMYWIDYADKDGMPRTDWFNEERLDHVGEVVDGA